MDILSEVRPKAVQGKPYSEKKRPRLLAGLKQ